MPTLVMAGLDPATHAVSRRIGLSIDGCVEAPFARSVRGHRVGGLVKPGHDKKHLDNPQWP